MPSDLSLNVFGSFTGTGVSPDLSSQSRHALDGIFNFSLSGTWVGTVEFQRKFDDGDDAGTWHTVDSAFTENTEQFGQNAGRNAYYRFECTIFTSGEIVFKANQ